MIHYHGTPITPDKVIAEAMRGAHFCVSHHRPDQLQMVAEMGSSFFVDNGAYSKWMKTKRAAQDEPADWDDYYKWLEPVTRLPGFDFAVIPDVIEGGEDDNDNLLIEWPFDAHFSAPVWHLHESMDRLERLIAHYPRVCLGSSGAYAQIGTDLWWGRMDEAMMICCDTEGLPKTKLHGLRMLDPQIVEAFPFKSGDSCTVAVNIGKDVRWHGTYAPPTKSARAAALRARIEHFQSPARYTPRAERVLESADVGFLF